jgi:hypothetical protein
VPKAGDRFFNKDYAETLRVLAKEGGDSFYRGTIARKIADDMAANGGIITFEDLAQYRAMERKPLVSRYQRHIWCIRCRPLYLRACRLPRRCRFSTTTCRRQARTTRTAPTTFITPSKPGVCATVAPESPIPSAGRSTTATILNPRTRSSGTG